MSTSLKPPDEIFAAEFRLLPRQWHADENYTEAFTKVPLLRYLLNGVIVTAASSRCSCWSPLPAPMRWPSCASAARQAIVRLGAARPADPGPGAGHPALHHALAAGMLNTYAALVLPFDHLGVRHLPDAAVLQTVPDDLIHAARLDGLGEFAIVWRIMLPTAMPALIAFGIFSVVAHWNDFFWPLIVVTCPTLATPPLGIAICATTRRHRLRAADGRRP